MQLCELFPTIQGEGRLAGTPCTFVRLSGCNLSCKWCDTPYHEKGEKHDPDVVAELIRRYGHKVVVFTGGEPLLQQEQILEVIDILKKEDFHFHIETNGTIKLIPRLMYAVDVTVSPKLSNAVEEESKLLLNSPSYDYKFVVRDEKDVLEVITFCEINEIHAETVYLMPEGATSAEQIKNAPVIWDLCIKYNLKFSPRLHVFLFSNNRRR